MLHLATWLAHAESRPTRQQPLHGTQPALKRRAVAAQDAQHAPALASQLSEQTTLHPSAPQQQGMEPAAEQLSETHCCNVTQLVRHSLDVLWDLHEGECFRRGRSAYPLLADQVGNTLAVLRLAMAVPNPALQSF